MEQSEPVWNAKDLLEAITLALPNITRFLRVDLKNESLSAESERLRARYDTLMEKLESAAGSATASGSGSRETAPAPAAPREVNLARRRHTTTDVLLDSLDGLPVSPDYDQLPAHAPSLPDITYTSFVLVKDQRGRWHKQGCRLDGLEQRLRLMESNDNLKVVQEYILGGAELLSGAGLNRVHEKEYVLTLVLPADGDHPKEEVVFAAYDSFEYQHWRDCITAVLHPEKPASALGGRRATVHGIPTDSNHDAIISSFNPTSGYVSPVTTKAPEELLRRPKQDPLPSLPVLEEKQKDSDTETIYEEIDALQELVDQHLKKADMLLQPLRGNKKWKNSLPSFSGFITRFKRGTARSSGGPTTPPLIPRPAINEEESDEYHGYLFKKSSKVPNLWKKKYCVLRQCIFAYYESPDDIEGHSIVLLGYSVESVQEKQAYVFKLSTEGVGKDILFAAENEEEFLEWWNRLDSATKAYDQEMDDGFAYEWMNRKNEELSTSMNSTASADVSVDSHRLTMDSGILEGQGNFLTEGEGIYDVPRSSSAPFGGKFFAGRAKMMEGIYDVPRSVRLLEDDNYDYPPDALEILGGSSSFDSSEATLRSLESLASKSSSSSDELTKLRLGKLPPVFGGLGTQENGPVTFSAGELAEIHPLSPSAESPYAVVNKLRKKSLDTDVDFSSCSHQGCLFRRERFQWHKTYCAIRGSYFELYKNDSLVTKLFLPGMGLHEDLDSKRPWSFKLKNPRREETLHLAAESDAEYQKWIVALNKACAIQIQSIASLEKARCVDPTFKEKWDSLEHLTRKDSSRGGTPSSERGTRSSKRRWRLGTSKGKESYSTSSLQRYTATQSNDALDQEAAPQQLALDAEGQPVLRRSHSFTSVGSRPTSQVVGSMSQTQKVYSPSVSRFIRGWLQLQQTKFKSSEDWKSCFCVLENLKMFCFTDEGCDELICNVSLRGARVSRASQECDCEFVFKVWHLETSRILFFKANNQEGFTRWMDVATNGADYVIPDSSTDSSQSLHRTPSFYYIPPTFEYPDDGVDEGVERESMYSSYESLASSVASCQGIEHYRGVLKRRNGSGRWLDRHCCVKDNKLLLYYTHSDLTPLSALVLSNAKVEVVQDSAISQKYHAFTIQPSEGPPKAMMFACSSEAEMWSCLTAMVEASQQTVKMSHQDTERMRKAIKEQKQPPLPKSPRKQREPQLAVPYSKLTGVLHFGMVDVKLGREPWTKYWCAVTDLYFHIYQTASSQVAVAVTHLPSCRIQLVGSMSRGTYMILLEQIGQEPIFISTSDGSNLGKWFGALELGIQRSAPEGASSAPESAKEGKKKKDKKASKTGKMTREDEIIKRFEKDVKKTRKVSHKADQNLKQQHMALMYMKRELDKHIRRLEERVQDGNEHAIAASQTLASKVLQIEQVLPYLEKCIKVNRQAELQTVAVLQKVRDEDLRKWKEESSEKGGAEVPHPPLEEETEVTDLLNTTLTGSEGTSEQASPQSPRTMMASTPMRSYQVPPPMPVKLNRTHTSDSTASQSSEIFIPKGGILTPEEFIHQVKTGQRPGSANSQKSDGGATPIAGSPMVLSPKRFTRSVSSGTPNAVDVGGYGGGRPSSRPGSAGGSRVHKPRALLQGNGTDL